MDSTMSSLGDEGDQCITVGQLCPPMAFTVRIEVQGAPLEAVVDKDAGMYAHQALMVRELDFKEPGRQEGSFRTELRLIRSPLSVYVLGSDPEAPEEVQGLIGLTPDELSICQSQDVDLTFIFAWLDGEEEPEEGELVLADLAVKNCSSTGTCSSWMTTKSSGESQEEREKQLLVVPGRSGRKSAGCAITSRQLDTRGPFFKTA